MARGPRKRAKEARAAAEAAAAAEAVAAELAATTASDRVAVKAIGGKKKRRRQQDDAEDLPVTPEENARRLQKWAEDTPKLDNWLQSRGGGLEPVLKEASGSIVRLRDFIPLEVADQTLTILENLPEEAWELSEHGKDGGAARHRFWSMDVCDVPELASLRGVFWRMLPRFNGEPTLPIFSCGRYAASDFIDRHDDRAHVPFLSGDNMYSRTVAAIWYLTREWTEEEGGCLMDLEKPEGDSTARQVPVYNSLVVFEVPHWHAVSAVTAKRYRYSIFGWWHQQGIRYALPHEELAAARPPKKKGKRKAVEASVAAQEETSQTSEPHKRKKKKSKVNRTTISD